MTLTFYMLAQTLPKAADDQVLTFLYGGAAILGIVVLLLKAIALGKELLGKDAKSGDAVAGLVIKLEARMDRIEKQFNEAFSEMNNKRERQMGEIHEKINRVERTTERILGRIEGTTAPAS